MIRIRQIKLSIDNDNLKDEIISRLKINSKDNGLVKWENKDPMAIINMIDNFIQENWK